MTNKCIAFTIHALVVMHEIVFKGPPRCVHASLINLYVCNGLKTLPKNSRQFTAVHVDRWRRKRNRSQHVPQHQTC